MVAASPSSKRLNLTDEFREGWNYIRGNTLILLIIILVALIGFFGFPFSNQIPALARNVLHQVADTEELVAARTGGIYLAQGVGALIAALFISSFSTMKRKRLLMSIGQFVFSAFLVMIAFAHSLLLALILIGVIGWATVTQFMMMNTLIQLDVPDELRGRVYSVYLWAFQGVAPFGSLFIGWLAQVAGVPSAAFVGGIICLVILFFTHIRWPLLHLNAG